MSEQHPEYLSDPETVDLIYNMLTDGNPEAAWTYLQKLGDPPMVAGKWIAVQCDVNNVKLDPHRSAEIGWAGVEYCMAKGFKKGTAILLHNIAAFFVPEFDALPTAEEVSMMVEAGKRQVELRRKIGDVGPLIWGLWDYGTAQMFAGNSAEAIASLEEGMQMAKTANDADAENWCLAMIGKTRCLAGNKERGEKELRRAVETIARIGEDWEKEGMTQLLKSVGLTR